MIALDDFPGDSPATSRDGRIADIWRRWLTRLLQVVRVSTQVSGGITVRQSASTSTYWLRSSLTLPAGLYRLSAAATLVSGTPTVTVSALVDQDANGTADLMQALVSGTPVLGGVLTGALLVRLVRGARIGYAAALTGGVVDIEFVVEALPASTRLG